MLFYCHLQSLSSLVFPSSPPFKKKALSATFHHLVPQGALVVGLESGLGSGYPSSE